MELENALYETDEYLMPYKTDIIRRHDQFIKLLDEIEKSEGLESFSKSYEKFGLHVNDKNEVIGKVMTGQPQIFNGKKKIKFF